MDGRNLAREEFWRLSDEELSGHDRFGVRQGMDPGVSGVPCNRCLCYRGFAKCEAYPNGIPAEQIRALMKDSSVPCGERFHFVQRKEESR